MMFKITTDDYILIKSHEEFLEVYPPTKRGEYRPQPANSPDVYPCLIKQLAIMDNPNGADFAIINIEHDFEEVASI